MLHKKNAQQIVRDGNPAEVLKPIVEMNLGILLDTYNESLSKSFSCTHPSFKVFLGPLNHTAPFAY